MIVAFALSFQSPRCRRVPNGVYETKTNIVIRASYDSTSSCKYIPTRTRVFAYFFAIPMRRRRLDICAAQRSAARMLRRVALIVYRVSIVIRVKYLRV